MEVCIFSEVLRQHRLKVVAELFPVFRANEWYVLFKLMPALGNYDYTLRQKRSGLIDDLRTIPNQPFPAGQ